MTKTALAFLVVVAAGTLLALWLGRTEPVPPAAPSDTVAAPAPTAPQPGSPATGPAPGRTEVPAARGAPAPDVAAAERPLRPGELAVSVQRGDAPVAGARVRVWRDAARRLQDTGLDGTAPERDGTTDADGHVMFAGLPAGSVVVRADDAAEWRIGRGAVAGGSNARAARVRLRFGDATVYGFAVDDDGAPRAGLAVYLAGLGRDAAAARTTTGRDGAYAFRAVTAGRYHVHLEQGAEWSADRERTLTVAAGESARCDFGPVRPAGTLQGRIVDAHGTVVPGVRQLRLVDARDNDERRVRTAGDGTFRVTLPHARWRVHAEDAGGATALATVDVGAFAQVDVPWPGIRLLGHVVTPPGVAPPDPDDLRRATYLRGPQGVQQAEHAFAHDGHLYLQWLELPPGDYVLQPQGDFRFADAPRAGIPLQLHGSQRVASVVLKIQPR